MPFALDCQSLSKTFDRYTAVSHVSLHVRLGQIMALLGPSGCGKTTTLRLIAGFEWPDTGSIQIKGRVVADDRTRIPPEERNVGMVFQEYALFPHLDVRGNIGFGLRGAEKNTRVSEMLALVGLENYGQRMPYELSGGQQQRVALARALAPVPDVLLLDEPFSNLDTALRAQVRAEVHAILKHAGITCVFVTHDQEEALSLADEVAVMFEGKIAQVAEPQQLYRAPATRAVAEFVGEANFVTGEAKGESVECVLGRLPLAQTMNGQVDVLVRPEALRLAQDDEQAHASVLWREFYGHDQRVGIRLDTGQDLVARADSIEAYSTGQRVQVTVQGRVTAYPR